MVGTVSIQTSLSAGELSPSIWGRTDLDKYHSGTTTCRNFFANYRGGVSSRAGLAYIGTCKQQYPIPPRDIPFQFSLSQGYVLEFGELYMRVKYRGAYVVEAAKLSTLSGGVFTSAFAHGYVAGDWVAVTGTNSFSGLTWIVDTVPTSTTFTVTDLFGNAISSSTGSSAFSSRVYTQVSPYHAVDLPYLKYTQSADVMTLCCLNPDTDTEYPPYSLTRTSNTSWTFTADTFAATITAPTGIGVVAQSSDIASVWYAYVVTAVNDNTGEESVASLPGTVQNNDIALTLGSNTITWAAVSTATSYNIYAAVPSYNVNVPVSSLYGFIGRSLGPSFTDTNITADFTKVPPQHNDPFVRGAVTDVNITAGGNGHYYSTTVGYSVTTSTGVGFDGIPVVDNGNVAGFVIRNHGHGYLSTDTIAFTDSGGGLSTGTATFTANPADSQSMNLGGVNISFAKSPAPPVNAQAVIGGAGNIYSQVENTTALTVQTLANNLNSSNLLSLSVASYVASGSVLTITYKTPGAVGNSYPMTTSSVPVTFSSGHLAGGGTAGSGATATLSIGPQSDTYPAVAAYFQQRRVYASSFNEPDTYWMSQPGRFSNMDSSIPVTASDSITGTPWAQQVNGIQFLVPMPGGLVVLTGKGAWQVNGGQSAAITPSNQTATPQAYNGCNGIVQPITINYDILYVQSKGSIWRDLSYNFFTNIYTGTDLTVLSNHLFTNYQMVQAAYAEEPYKLVWVVRDDGILLCLTYLKEQDVYSWTRHDTDGLFVGVCSVTEPPVDAVYVLTQRYVQGDWRYYSERMDDRVWNNIDDSYCVDSGITNPLTFPNATLTASAATGGNVIFTASSAVFAGSDGEVGNVVRYGGGIGTVTGSTTTTVTAILSEDITSVIPNDPGLMPRPQPPGTWSISTPISVLTGLNHLEGLTVTGLADGSVIESQDVLDGSITLPVSASKIVVGLKYTCQVQTMYLDVQSQSGTIQNRRKNISQMGIRLEASRGVRIGADQLDSSARQNYAPVAWTHMTEIKERSNMVSAGIGIPLYTGDYQQGISSGWNLKGQMAVDQIYPLPANVLAVIAFWDLGDDQ